MKSKAVCFSEFDVQELHEAYCYRYIAKFLRIFKEMSTTKHEFNLEMQAIAARLFILQLLQTNKQFYEL